MITVVETEVFSCYASDYWTEDGVKHLPSGLRKTITPVMSCAILAFVAKYGGHVKVLVKAVGSACAQRRSQDSNRHHRAQTQSSWKRVNVVTKAVN